LRKRYPNKSFLIVAIVSRSSIGEITFHNPTFCFSKAREAEVNKQLRIRTQRVAPSGSGMMSLDSFSASRVCKLFHMPKVSGVEGFPVYPNFALYRFGSNGTIIAENAGVDQDDSGTSVMQNMTSVRCIGRDVSDQELSNLKPISLN
jgi:hypothetical protein